jgi:large repetitive protein
VTLGSTTLQYSPATSSSWTAITLNSSAVVPAGGHYLVQLGNGAIGDSCADLIPDRMAPTSIAGSGGKLALALGTTLTCGSSCAGDFNVIDLVGYGSTANDHEGSAISAGVSGTQAYFRGAAGCTDSDDNGTDFSVNAAGPRSSADAAAPCPNHPPIAVADAFMATEDTELTVPPGTLWANDSDPDGDPIMHGGFPTGPSFYSGFTGGGGGFIYTPEPNFNGTDHLTYLDWDGVAESNPAPVTITVIAVNDPPVAVADSFSTPQGTALAVGAPGLVDNDTDVEGDSLTARLAGPPAHGHVTMGSGGAFTYMPDPGFSGDDSFTYQADDGADRSDTASVSVTVVPAPPAAGPGDTGAGAGGGGGSGPQPQPAPATRLSPQLKLSGSSTQRLARNGSFAVLIRSSAGGPLVGEAVINAPGAARAYRLARVRAQLAPGARAKLVFKLSRRALRATRAALARHKRVTATVKVTAAGTAATTKIRLKR